jgi:hypothetical protein
MRDFGMWLFFIVVVLISYKDKVIEIIREFK